MKNTNAEHKNKLNNLRAIATKFSKNKNSVLAEIGQCWIAAQKELQDFADKVPVNPVHAMEWSSSAFKAAAEREILDPILRAAADKTRALPMILEMVRDEITRRVLGNFDRPSSSSQTSNALNILKAEVRSKYVGDDGFFAEWLDKLQRAEAAFVEQSDSVRKA